MEECQNERVLAPNSLILAPMDGITDAPMRELMGEIGAFDFAVSEFVRVSQEPVPAKVFRRDVPELLCEGRTRTGLPVVVQLLGSHPERVAESAKNAVAAGAKAIDLNFGCPAKVVNGSGGGALLLKSSCAIYEIVKATRSAVSVPVSAKLRLGWDSVEPIYENVRQVEEAGASWVTIHARTRMQGYQPPVYWEPVAKVRERTRIPVIVNGDIWTAEDYRRCRAETGCEHVMLGRGAMANPFLTREIRGEEVHAPDWSAMINHLVRVSGDHVGTLLKAKGWLKLAAQFGSFDHFDTVKHCETLHALVSRLAND